MSPARIVKPGDEGHQHFVLTGNYKYFDRHDVIDIFSGKSYQIEGIIGTPDGYKVIPTVGSSRGKDIFCADRRPQELRPHLVFKDGTRIIPVREDEVPKPGPNPERR